MAIDLSLELEYRNFHCETDTYSFMHYSNNYKDLSVCYVCDDPEYTYKVYRAGKSIIGTNDPERLIEHLDIMTLHEYLKKIGFEYNEDGSKWVNESFTIIEDDHLSTYTLMRVDANRQQEYFILFITPFPLKLIRELNKYQKFAQAGK